MIGFTPSLFKAFESNDWWRTVSPQARILWLTLVNVACEAGQSTVAINPRRLIIIAGLDEFIQHPAEPKTVKERQGELKVLYQQAKSFIAELVNHGAIIATENETHRHIYEVVGFQEYVDALGTHKAQVRKSYHASKARGRVSNVCEAV
jgi:hypothetical protein